MTKAPQKIGISRQIILIVLLVIVLITGGLSVVMAVSSFNNLASITLQELGRMSKIFSSQLEELQANAVRSVTDIVSNPQLRDQLEQLTNLGPYYYSDASLLGTSIEESDKIYTLEAQVRIVQALRPLKNLHKLSSISLYALSPFDLIPYAQPVLSVRMDSDGIWLGSFTKKGEIDKRSYYYSPSHEFVTPDSGLFNVSSVYQLTVQTFYESINFSPMEPVGFEDVLLVEDFQDLIIYKRKRSDFVVHNGVPIIRTQAVLEVSVANPETWEAEKASAMLIVLEQEVGGERLATIKRQLGVDIGLAQQNKIIVSSLASDNILGELNSDQTVEGRSQRYYYAEQEIDFLQQKQTDMKAVVLSPISILAELTQKLFEQVTLFAILATVVASLLIYWAIRRLVNHPLSLLMTGVEKISAGELDHQVEVRSKNELGQLAFAFNNMSSELSKKTDQLQNYASSLESSNVELKRYQTTLEEMVEQRTSKLQSAQKQLIEAEKMASLGELVAGVAHEINTPVGVGVTAASFLMDETKSINKKYLDNAMTKEDFDDFLKCNLQTTDMILSNLQRATELVKSFKQVAVDQTAEERRLFLVINYIEEILLTLHPRLKKTQHSIKVSGDKQIEIDSYPGSFSQIVTNLIMNSVIHAFEDGIKGQIKIDITREDEYVVLTYSDNGIGVDTENLAKIFDPFFTTKRGFGGTGLGMHIVYNLVTQKLKGLIKCESVLGEGVKFIISIPIEVGTGTDA